jgi:hypothetical protein
VSSVVLFIIALAAPWAVHLAPPRQRAVALVGVIAILLLFGIFAENPLGKWEFWVGLLVGIISILVASTLGLNLTGGGRPRRRVSRHRRSPLDESGSEPTGEL